MSKDPVTANLLKDFKVHEPLCKALVDAFALVSIDGKVIKCNSMLSQILGLKTKQILKSHGLHSLLSFIHNGMDVNITHFVEDENKNRYDNVIGICRSGPNKGVRFNLILGIQAIRDTSNRVIGLFLIIRNVTAETQLVTKYKNREQESITDALTQLYNRNYLEEYLQGQAGLLRGLSIDEHPKSAFTLAMIDIDFFKKINDVYGHQAGDYALKELAVVMEGIFRKSDIICRYGGEEFTAILPATDLDGAAIALEKFREATEKHTFIFEGTKFPITVSIGYARIRPDESIDSVLARADEALYFSKKNGRNQINAAEHIKLKSA